MNATAALLPASRTAPEIRRRKTFLHPTTLLALLFCAGIAGLAWWSGNRPAAIPPYSGKIGGLAFSPFRQGQSPETGVFPSTAEVRSDLAIAARMTRQIRTYTVAGVQGEIPRLARGLGLSVTLGAWLDPHLDANAAEIGRLIAVANANPNVEAVMVGNETILRGDLSPSELIGYIDQVKKAVRVPVSTAEPWHVWLHHPELAAAVDFITIHLLPYWEGLPIADALQFTMQKLQEVEAAFPGKRVVIGEIGWPSNGVTIGAAVASRINQADFLRRFFRIAARQHLDYFVMEAFDQPWKTSFEGRAAGYWGMDTLGRRPKWPLVGPVWEHPDWPRWAAGAVAGGLLLAWLLLWRRPDLRLGGKVLVAGLSELLAASLAAAILAMAGKYLSGPAAAVWCTLIAGQVLLLLLVLADGFAIAETLFVRGFSRRYVPRPMPAGTRLPKVSIHVPICSEPPQMVRQTLDALALLDYPDFEVLVVDNNTTDPALWEPVAEHCARLGPRFRFFHLGRWPGFKAGALNFALGETAADAEIIGVLDSDYVVSHDWLKAMVPAFADPRVGFTQSPQDYRDNDGSLFKRLMFWEYAGFFRLGMVTRNERNAIIQHGTMTLIRRAAISASGGWAEWCITEDSELGLRLMRQGWQAVYAEESFGRGVMPDDFAAYRKQRFRWAYGAMRISRAHWRSLFSPFDRRLSLGQRWHFITGWLPWLGDGLGLVFLLMGLAWSVGLIVAPMRIEFPIVLFMLPSLGLFVFKVAELLVLYRSRVPCGLRDRLGAAVAGLALSHTIGKAVLKGLVTRRVPFLRTPKMKNAPVLVQGLCMAREEVLLLVLTWAAMIGVGAVHDLATWEVKLWCLILFTQSLPYLAAVSVALLAAMPTPDRAAVAMPVQVQALLPTAGATLASGD
jgi:exo-beta-1,3-glucanase (GH17 family)/cellulose synthase/poly-beta-1,6-N-acetylglucosamine synthase-like glycosyltransferase